MINLYIIDIFQLYIKMLFRLPDALIKYTTEFLSEYSLRCLDNAITNRELRKTWLKFLCTYNCCMYRYEKTQILFDEILSNDQYNDISTIYINQDIIIITIRSSYNNHYKTKIMKYNINTKRFLNIKVVYDSNYTYNALYYIYINVNNKLCYLNFDTFKSVCTEFFTDNVFSIYLHVIPNVIIITTYYDQFHNYDFINDKLYLYPSIEYLNQPMNILLPNYFLNESINESNVYINYYYIDNKLYSMTYDLENFNLTIKNYFNNDVYNGFNICFSNKLILTDIENVQLNYIGNIIYKILILTKNQIKLQLLIKMENNIILPIDNQFNNLSSWPNAYPSNINPTNELIFYNRKMINNVLTLMLYILNINKNTMYYICSIKLTFFIQIINIFSIDDKIYILIRKLNYVYFIVFTKN